MKTSDTITTMAKYLEKTLIVVDELRSSLKGISTTLKEYEGALILMEAQKHHHLFFNSQSRFVCLTQDGSRNDPVKRLLKDILKSDVDLPSVILLSQDIRNSMRRVESVLKSKVKVSTKTLILLHIRWSTMLPQLEDNKNIVVGTRYQHTSRMIREKFEKTMINIGFTVSFDHGEYGGGTLTYKLMSRLQSIMILEITLSESVIRDTALTISLLESFAKI